MDRRAELEGWIARTRRLQRRMAVLYGALAAVAIAVLFWSRTAGGFALFGVALLAVCSFWVTAAHNAAHRQKLAELTRVEDNGGRPLETGHRRWQAAEHSGDAPRSER
ncbi:MAG TPA: hypothetical protein VGD37_02480 [Kofleriaceae bacterium]